MLHMWICMSYNAKSKYHLFTNNKWFLFALEVVKVGGICTPPSPFDKYCLTNVFDDVEAVADCLGAISIPHQPEKEKRKSNLDRQASGLIYSLHASFYYWKNDAVELLVHSSTQTQWWILCAIFSIKPNRVNPEWITLCIICWKCKTHPSAPLHIHSQATQWVTTQLCQSLHHLSSLNLSLCCTTSKTTKTITHFDWLVLCFVSHI